MTGSAQPARPGRRYDVAVVGAGPAGSTAALRLRANGVRRVLLAEAGDLGGFRIGESVPPDTRLLLAELGVLRAFLAQGHDRCLGSRSSWGADEVGYNDFVTNPHGPGWHLDRGRFDALLADEAERRGVRIERGWRLVAQRGRAAGGGYELELRSGDGGTRRVSASLVVDATGQRARFARLVGVRRRYADRRVTVAGRFAVGDGRLDRLTFLEATSYGWWYAARLAGGKAVVSVTTDPATCRRRALREPASWLAHLAGTRHLGARLDGAAFDPEGFTTHPASTFRLDPVCGRDWLAAGDAAATYDPLAAQGIYKALADGLRAGDALARRLDGEAPDLGDYATDQARRYRGFLDLRAHLYSLETRWPDAPFWKARAKARQRVPE